MRIRQMTPDDIPAAERVSAHAFYELDLHSPTPGRPEPQRRTPERAERWVRRLHHLIGHDSPGCWVAEDVDGTIVGEAVATSREGLWGLSNYAVLPGHQARGLGKQLLEAALQHGSRSSPGYICASGDPRAVRRYRLAGFDLHPAMLLAGSVDRTSIPAELPVRAGGLEDVELLDEIDRCVRDAAHGPDHPVMIQEFTLKVVSQGPRRGYAFHQSDGSPYLLAATDTATATTLLWACLAESQPDSRVEFDKLTASQGWAVDVGLAAGLALHGQGFVALRHLEPPTPYIPSDHFL